MQITFAIRGPQAGLVSYFFGKHPDHPYLKRTRFGTVEFKFTEYSLDFVKGFIAYHPNAFSLMDERSFRGLDELINDRPFVLSSLFLSQIRSSIGHVLSREYDQIDTLYDIELNLAPLHTQLTDEEITALYEPLDYEVTVDPVNWSKTSNVDFGRIVQVNIRGNTDIVSTFRHVYVLIPVIDNDKHHRIGDDEVDKLLRYGEGWLAQHPQLQLIVKRYLRYGNLMDKAYKHLGTSIVTASSRGRSSDVTLREMRYDSIMSVIREADVRSVVDMGAGEGRLLERLVQDTSLEEVIACEPSERGRLNMLRRMDELRRQGRLFVEPEIWQSSLFYNDVRLRRRPCIVLCEVLEHIDRDRLDQTMAVLLSTLEPQRLILTTPNREYNAIYDLGDQLRHPDHRFEMTREEFQTFIDQQGRRHHYRAVVQGIGPHDSTYGTPTLMAILEREE